MVDLRGLTLAIVGAGAVGLTLGVRASQAGARTTVYGLGAAIDSASGVAAGMLAPAFEAALDPVSAGHFDLLRAARDAWPELIAALDHPLAVIDTSGALRAGAADEEALLTALQGRLQAMGAASERLDSVALRRLRPELASTLAGAVYTSEDWRIDPLALLPVLETALGRSGGRRVAAEVAIEPSGRFVAEGDAVVADAVVVAAGPGALAWRNLLPELAALHPIKGQILSFAAGPQGGAVVRGPFGYVTPQPGGAVVGATMEPGRSDLSTDAVAVERLRSGAQDLFPALAGAAFQARAGVRVATADGLPLVGASRRAGVQLAVGARRNGWLLAPLIADIIVNGFAGRTSSHAGLMQAGRPLA